MFDELEPPDISQSFAQLGYDFMGACFEVHRILGGGLLEEIYQESLELELEMRSIPFTAKQLLSMFLQESTTQEVVRSGSFGRRENIVEIKSCKALISDHEVRS